jgi:hypothetical protein
MWRRSVEDCQVELAEALGATDSSHLLAAALWAAVLAVAVGNVALIQGSRLASVARPRGANASFVHMVRPGMTPIAVAWRATLRPGEAIQAAVALLRQPSAYELRATSE